MSRTIEQKVVEMRFDNSNFEKNVSQSMDSLNRLKATIDKTSSGNAFTGLSKALDNINIGSVTTAIQTVTEKFSVWEQVAIGAARNIGAALSNYVVKGLNNMVFKNVSVGWDKYAQKTEAVQTIMASIADQDFGNTDKMEYVEGLMEKLNWFTDETSYHLTDMISNIGKFTSAGVDLDKASDAMMGIATWAAVSGANADTASRVMYQLSQSLGMGSVRTQDWMSVETANMATKEFKELAIQVAKTKKEINSSGKAKNGGKNAEVVTFQNFRQTLKDGWLTSDVLTETLAQYSGFANALNRVYDAYGGNVPTSTLIKRFKMVQAEAKKSGKTLKEVFKEKYDIDVDFSVRDKVGNVIGDLTKNITELGMRAFIAAQEAKTFKEAMDSVGDAASTVWMRVYETIFGNYEVAKDLWTNLANDLYELFVDPIWLVSDAFEEWSKQGGRSLLFGREIVSNDDGTESIIPTGAFDIFIRTVIDASNALRDGFLGALGVTEDNVDEFTGGALMKFSRKILELSKRFQQFIGPVEDLTKKFKNFFGFFTDIIGHIDIFNQKSEDSLDIVGLIKYRFEDAFSRVENVLSRIKSIIGYVKDGLIAFFDALKFNGTSVQNFTDTAENLGAVGDDIAKALSPITLMFSKLGELGKKAGTFISNLIATLSFIPKEITGILRNTNLLSNGAFALKKILDAVRDGFNSAFDSSIFVDIRDAFKFVWSGIKTFIDGFTDNFDIYDKVKTIANGIGSAINLIGRAIRFLLKPIEVLDGMGVFNEIGKFLSGTVLKALLSIPATIAKIVTKINEFIKAHPKIQEVWEGISSIFGSLIKFVMGAGSAFSDFIERTKPLSKVGQFVKNIFEAFKQSTVLTEIGKKISGSFEKIVTFFREKFYFDAFKNKMNEISESISAFVDKSSLLSSIRNAFKSVWDGIKKMFSADADFSGFVKGFDTVAGAIIKFVKTIWSGVKGVGKFIFSIFGGDSPEGGLDEVGEEVESFGEKVEETIDTAENTLTSVKDRIKGFFYGIKTQWDKLGVKKWSDEVFGSIKEAISNIKDQLKPIKREAPAFQTNLDDTTTGVTNIFNSLMKVFGTAIPTFLAGSFVSGLLALTHPITALGDVVNTLLGTIRSYQMSERISAIGSAISDVLKSLGIFVLSIAGASVILAYAESISGGNLAGIYVALGAFIGEVIGGIVFLLKSVKSLSTINASAKKGEGVSFNRNKDETSSWIASIGEIFVQIGQSLLMVAGAVAALALVDKLNPGSLLTAAAIIEAFLLTLFFIGKKIADAAVGQTTTSGGFSLSKGLSFERSGWADGLYSLGKFMETVGSALLMVAASAALIMVSAKGDTKTMLIAFGFMEVMLLTLVGGVLLITKASKEMDSVGNTSKIAVKLSGFASFFIAAALAINIIAKTAVMLGSQKDSDIDKGVEVIGKIGLIMLALTFVSGLMKEGKFKSVGFMMLEAAIALAIIGEAVKNIGSVDETGMQKAMDVIIASGVIFGLLTAVASLTSGGALKFMAFGTMMVEMASAFLLMSAVVKILSSIDNTKVDSVIGVLFAMVGAMTILFLVMSLASSNALGILVASVALVAMAAALDLVVAGIISAGLAFSQNEGALESAVGAIALAVAAIAALSFIAALAGPSLIVFGLGLIAVGVGLSAIAASVLIVSLAITALTAALKIVLTMGDSIVDAMKTFFKAIAKAAPELTDALIAIVGGIVTAIAANLEGIIEIVLTILNRILGVLAEFLPTLLENLTIIVNAIVDLLINVLLNAIDRFLFADNGVLAIVDKALTSETGLLAIIRRALMGENGILTIIDEFIHQLLENLRNLVTDIIDTLVYILQEIVDGMIEHIDIVLTGVEDLINKVVEHIVSLTDTILGGIVDVVEGIATAIENHGSDLWKAIWHVVTAIFDSFWGLFDGDGEHSIGKLAENFMAGLGEGLRNFVGKVTSAIGWIVDKIFGTFEDDAEIHSPSKVMMKMGEYLDLGLAEGITDGAASPIKSITGLGGGIIDSLKSTFLGDEASGITGLFGDNLAGGLNDALGGITDVLDTDDFTPTITPVLDLSEIQNGASQIPGMINPGSGYTVNTAMVSKSAYNPYEYYDGTEKVSTSQSQLDYFEVLKSKMDEMVNKFASAKVVLDTGAVVGGIVDPMDMALGQRMAQVGRGVYSSTR